MKMIHQSAAVIKPKKIFTDMLRSINSIPTPIKSLQNDRNVILIPDFDMQDNAVDFLRKNYQKVLRNELREWLGKKETDEFLTGVSYSLFRMWFDVEIHQTVRDVIDDDLTDTPSEEWDKESAVNLYDIVRCGQISAPDEYSSDEDDFSYSDLTLPYAECAYSGYTDNSEVNLFA